MHQLEQKSVDIDFRMQQWLKSIYYVLHDNLCSYYSYSLYSEF
jgi:hypothetical protein